VRPILFEISCLGQKNSSNSGPDFIMC